MLVLMDRLVSMDCSRNCKSYTEGNCFLLNEFIIFTEDIPEALAKELESLGNVKMKRVIINAVLSIYDSVDSEYSHTNGIYGKIKWRFAPSKK